jgi:hypothetical protein
VALLNELDGIYTENPNTDLKQALWILEDDLFRLYQRERFPFLSTLRTLVCSSQC